MFLVLYFCYSSFQCLFFIYGFIGLNALFFSNFSLYSSFVCVWVGVYEFVCSCLINVAFNICLWAFSVCSLFVCVLEFFPPCLYFFFSLLWCMAHGLLVLQQGFGSEPPRWDNWGKDVGWPENSWILTMRALSKAFISTQRPDTIQRSASSTTRCSHQATSKAGKKLYQLADRLLKVIPNWQKHYNTPLGMMFNFRKTISNSNQ